MTSMQDQLLVEDLASRRPFLQKQFPDLTDEELADAAEVDPTGDQGSYIAWILKSFRWNGGYDSMFRQGLLRGYTQALAEILGKFHDLKSKPGFVGDRDINKYRHMYELNQTVRRNEGLVTKGERKRDLRRDGVVHLKHQGEYDLYKITNAVAAAHVFRGTTWCVKDPKWFDNDTYAGSPFFYIAKDGEPYILYHPGTGEFKDVENRDVSRRLPDFSSLFSGVDFSFSDLGSRRLDQLRGFACVRISRIGGRVSFDYVGGTGFISRANAEYLSKTYDFVDSDGEIDAENHAALVTRLGAVDTDTWDAFAGDIEGLDAYPVLDEDRVSEMEFEALSEWLDSEGFDDFKKAAADLDAFQDSFAQFALTRVPKSHFFELARDEDWQTEDESVTVDVRHMVKDMTLDDITVDQHGKDSEKRLRGQFLRYKRYAWNRFLRDGLRAAVRARLTDDPATVARFDNVRDGMLFQHLLRLTPDSNYGTDDPAWYPDEEVVKTSGESTWTRYTTLEYWNLRLGGESDWQSAVDVVADEIVRIGIDAIARAAAADDPRQMSFQGILDAPVEVKEDLEDLEHEAGDVFVENWYSDDFCSVVRVKHVDTLTSVVDPAVLGTFHGRYRDQEWFERHGADEVILAVTLHTKEYGDVQSVWRLDFVDKRILGLATSEDSEDLEALEKEAVYRAIRANLDHADYDESSMLQMLLDSGGYAAVEPAKDRVTGDNLPGFANRVLVDCLAAGRYKEARRYMSEKDGTVRMAPKGLYILFSDWEDMVPLFGKSSRYNYKATAERVFAGDYINGIESTGDFRSAFQDLTERHYATLRQVLPGRMAENDDGTSAILTAEQVQSMSDRDIGDLLRENENNSDFEDIVNALTFGQADVVTRMQESAMYEACTEAVMDAIGAKKFKWFAVKSAKGIRTDSLGFLVPAKVLRDFLDKALEDTGEIWQGTWQDLLLEIPDKASLPDDPYKRLRPEEVEDLYDFQLGELEAPEGNDFEPKMLVTESAGPLFEGYDFGCLMVEVPRNVEDFIQDWGRSAIQDDLLYHSDDPDDHTHGRESDTHITVKWGIQLQKPSDELSEIVGSTRPFGVQIGKVSLFSDKPEYDVVKLEVTSLGLRALHARVKGGVPNTETYPTYNPHCTVAYVRKGTCNHLVGQDIFATEGAPMSSFVVKEVVYQSPGESGDPARRHVLKLSMRPVREDIDPFSDLGFPADASRLRRRTAKKNRVKRGSVLA